MNKKIEDLAEQLRLAIAADSTHETVSVGIDMNMYGTCFEIFESTPLELKDQGINTKNIKGEWIRGES